MGAGGDSRGNPREITGNRGIQRKTVGASGDSSGNPRETTEDRGIPRTIVDARGDSRGDPQLSMGQIVAIPRYEPAENNCLPAGDPRLAVDFPRDPATRQGFLMGTQENLHGNPR